MKKFIKSFIASALIIILVFGLFAGCTNNNESATTSETAKINISYSGMADALYTFDGVDYYATKDGFFVENSNGKTEISSLECTGKFTIINDIIYYSVIEHHGEPIIDIMDENGEKTHFDWCYCSAYKMNLDGSNNEKIMDVPTGRCEIIYANDNSVYYLSDDVTDEATIYRSEKGYAALYKYDFDSQKLEMLKDYVCMLPFYYNNNIFFSTGHSNMNLWVCSINDGGSITSIKEAEDKFVDYAVALDETHILFSAHDEEFGRYIYNLKDKSVNEYTDNFAGEFEQYSCYNTNINGLIRISTYGEDNAAEYSFRYGQKPVKIIDEEYSSIRFIDDTTFIGMKNDDENVYCIKNGKESVYKTVQNKSDLIIYLGENVYAEISDRQYANIGGFSVKSYK